MIPREQWHIYLSLREHLDRQEPLANDHGVLLTWNQVRLLVAKLDFGAHNE